MVIRTLPLLLTFGLLSLSCSDDAATVNGGTDGPLPAQDVQLADIQAPDGLSATDIAPFSPDKLVGKCPAAVPSGDCPEADRVCWYGDDPRPHCRTAAKCVVSGDPTGPSKQQWAVTPDPCQPQPDECPADPKAPPPNLCSKTMVQDCFYLATVEWCGCYAPNVVPAKPPYWTCSSALPQTPGCPAIAPNVGLACVPEGITCTYPFLYNKGTWCFLELNCVDGYWTTKGVVACMA